MRFEMIDDDSGKMMPVPSNDAECAFLHANPELAVPMDPTQTIRVSCICGRWLTANGGPCAVGRRWANKENIDGPWEKVQYGEERTRRMQEEAECKKEKLQRCVKELRNLARNLISDPDYLEGLGRKVEAGAVKTLVWQCACFLGVEPPEEMKDAHFSLIAQIALDWIPPDL